MTVATLDLDAEHELAALRRACVEGRLTLQEYADLARAVVAGDTGDAARRDVAPAPVASHDPRPRRPEQRWVRSVFASSRHRGRWLLPARLGLLAAFGGVHVDLSQASIDGDDVELVAVALFGTVKIAVPPGIDVEVSGPAALGARKAGGGGDPLPGAPRVRIRAVPLFGTVEVL